MVLQPRVERLPYLPNVARRFAAVAAQPWAVWLDSGFPESGGRYDVCVADPCKTFVSQNGVLHISTRDDAWVENGIDPYDYLRSQLAFVKNVHKIPFLGGLAGYFGYEFGRRAEGLSIRDSFDAWPEMALGLYDWALVTDHLAGRCWLTTYDRSAVSEKRWSELISLFRDLPPFPELALPKLPNGWESNFRRADYDVAFARVKNYILEGDCYQVNLAQRFCGTVSGEPWDAYRYMRKINPAPYGAYLNLPCGHVLSSSPERFVAVENGIVTTRPIKGTRPRSNTRKADEQLRSELRLSTKDQAENLMIVDLLRNDLGKVCRPGSVTVPKLFAVESFASVHHLVSEVQGLLRADQDLFDLLRASFPGGSITGAPKRRAMEIIDELEPDRRGVYCGSIGWLGHDGNMDSNIAIRTMTWSGDRVCYAAGGGIVADSTADAEYQETLDKAASFFRLFNAPVSRY